MLGRIAQDAAAVYAELENSHLRERVATLERVASTAGSPRSRRPRSKA
jgi:NhaP-type Na+/H+ and K+/H+ antiporter